jgi:hypothetical protein
MPTDHTRAIEPLVVRASSAKVMAPANAAPPAAVPVARRRHALILKRAVH